MALDPGCSDEVLDSRDRIWASRLLVGASMPEPTLMETYRLGAGVGDKRTRSVVQQQQRRALTFQ